MWVRVEIARTWALELCILWRCVEDTASPIDCLLFSLQYMGLYVFNWPISVLGDWKDISIAHVIIIIKSEVSTFPIVIIFFRGCVPEMVVTSYSVTQYCIYVPGKPGICFHYYCAVYDECKYSDTFWLADRTRLFVQHTISLSSLCKGLSEGIELIKCLSDIFCRVCE